jgi:hypothetical protein
MTEQILVLNGVLKGVENLIDLHGGDDVFVERGIVWRDGLKASEVLTELRLKDATYLGGLNATVKLYLLPRIRELGNVVGHRHGAPVYGITVADIQRALDKAIESMPPGAFANATWFRSDT